MYKVYKVEFHVTTDTFALWPHRDVVIFSCERFLYKRYLKMTFNTIMWYKQDRKTVSMPMVDTESLSSVQFVTMSIL